MEIRKYYSQITRFACTKRKKHIIVIVSNGGERGDIKLFRNAGKELIRNWVKIPNSLLDKLFETRVLDHKNGFVEHTLSWMYANL